MKTTIYLLPFILLISACTKTNSTSDNKPAEKEINIPANTNKLTKEGISKLDSIDKINNESVVAFGDYITKAFVFLNDSDSTIH